MNFRSFKLNRVFGPAQYVKCRRLFLELNSKGFYSGSKRGRKFRRRMSTSSIKHQIRRFHVVVVQWTSKKCTKERDAPAELLFWSLNQLFFWSCRCGRRRSCLNSLLINCGRDESPPQASLSCFRERAAEWGENWATPPLFSFFLRSQTHHGQCNCYKR